MAKKRPTGKRHDLQDATKPLDDFDRLARKRLGLPPPEKLVNPSRRRWLPPLLLLLLALLLIGYGVHHYRSRSTALAPRRLLTVSFLDVGQGDSTLIQTPSGKNILVDTGPRAAQADLFAELGRRGVKQLDMLITSHHDKDHNGNNLAVLRSFPVATVVDSGYYRGGKIPAVLSREIQRQNIQSSQVAQQLTDTSKDIGDGVTLSYLAPAKYANYALNLNDTSIILKVSMGKVGFLLMGDAEETERATLLASGQNVQATVLKVAHHGSRTGTDRSFLLRVQPEIAVISCGAWNSYNHPDPEALDVLLKSGVTVFRTDRNGTINVETDGETYTVSPSAK